MSSWDNLKLAVQQKASGVTGDQHSPWTRAGNTPGQMLDVGSRWAQGVGQNVSAWRDLTAPAHKGEANERPATKAEIAARALRAAQGTIGAITGGLGVLKDALDVGFANLTAPIAAIFPSLPAATIVSPYLGTPHAHPMHPPSGPLPVPPTPCPSMGMTLLGVSPRVLINSMPAARCEDIGLAPTCMGLPPAWFRIKTGSSNVFIGGARAARLLDICKACKNIPDPPSIPAGKVMAAIGKAAGAVSSAMAVAGVVGGALGIAADVTESAVEDDAAMAAGKALSAAMASVQMAADAAKQAVEATMWKDPTLPPTGSMGAVIDPSHATVLIGGFPMINIPDPVGALLNRLKRYKASAPAANGGCGKEGEPVDVVTGANLETSADLPLHVGLKLTWTRHYDSGRKHERGPLGWGWRHELECKLTLNVDGVLYQPAAGDPVPFPPLAHDGESGSRRGWTLIRVEASTYRLVRAASPAQDFTFPADSSIGRLSRVFNSTGSIRLAYDANGRLSEIRGADESPIHLEYDGQGLLVRVSVLAGDSSTTRLSYEYDASDNLVAWTDALGHAAKLDYDDKHQLTRKGDRRGYSYHYAYDTDGRCVHTRGEDGLYDVRLSYLTDVRCTRATHADGGVWAYFYDENGTITRIVDPYGKARERIVGQEGDVLAEIDGAGNEYRLLYDAAGGLVGRRDPFGHVDPDLADLRRHNHLELRATVTPIEWEHGALLRPDDIRGRRAVRTRTDLLGRKIEEHVSERATRQWTRDENGNVVVFQDADGSTRRYEYFSWNLLGRDIDPNGYATEYEYTPRERVRRVVDPGGTVSEYAYDLRDNIVRVTRHGRVREEYVRDATDNLIEKRDGQGRQLLSFEIGPGNLKTVRRLASGDTHRFEYDSAGRLIRAATNDHDTRFEYTTGGRASADIRDGRGVRHYGGGLRPRRTVVFDRFEIHYARAVDGTVTITDPTGGRHRIAADRRGTIVLDTSNGSVETRLYDADGRCLSKTRSRRGGWQPWVRAYEYSAEGNLERSDDSLAGRSQYRYDPAHRLVEEIRPNGARIAYSYDPAGNLVAQNGLADVVIANGNRCVAANREYFTYNDRDLVATRETDRGVVQFEYDSCDRLIGARSPAGDWSSAYDPLGRRIGKRWKGETTAYYWDDNRLAAELGASGSLRIYVYADADALVPFMWVDYASDTSPAGSGRCFFLATNQIGCPIQVEDDQGATVWQAVVEPYGTTHVRPGSTVGLTLRFPGHQEDAEMGLFYNRFRHYSPALGRYLQSDPMGLAGSGNLYAYPSNPLTSVDLFGLTHPPKSEDDDGSATKTGQDDENLLQNQLPERLPAELALAEEMGVKPLRPGDPGFDDMVNAGPIKWVVAANGELLAVPHSVEGVEIPHTVASGGQPVKAAGEANIASADGQAMGLDIDPHSGHYLNGATPEQSAASEQAGRDAFEKNGITFPPSGGN